MYVYRYMGVGVVEGIGPGWRVRKKKKLRSRRVGKECIYRYTYGDVYLGTRRVALMEFSRHEYS